MRCSHHTRIVRSLSLYIFAASRTMGQKRPALALMDEHRLMDGWKRRIRRGDWRVAATHRSAKEFSSLSIDLSDEKQTYPQRHATSEQRSTPFSICPMTIRFLGAYRAEEMRALAEARQCRPENSEQNDALHILQYRNVLDQCGRRRDHDGSRFRAPHLHVPIVRRC